MVFRIHLLHAFHASVKHFYSDNSENRSLNLIRNTRGSSLERCCTYLKIIDSVQIFSKTFLPLLCFENLIDKYPWHCIYPLMLQHYCAWCCNDLQNYSCRHILEGNVPLAFSSSISILNCKAWKYQVHFLALITTNQNFLSGHHFIIWNYI